MSKNGLSENNSTDTKNVSLELEKEKMLTNNNTSRGSTLTPSSKDCQNKNINNLKKKGSFKKTQTLSSSNMNKNNFFFKIDSKNVFKQFTNSEDDIISEKIEQYKNTFNREKTDSTGKILEKYFKEMNKIGWNVYYNSLNISKQICSSYNTKDSIENYINYFYTSRYEITYASTFILNMVSIKNLGQILCYIFSKISSKPDITIIKTNLLKSLKEKKNPLIDYYSYCNEKGKDTNKYKKTNYWDKFKNNYNVPAELIFLANLFFQINTLEIDINFQDENFNEDDFKLYFILMQNLDLVFLNMKYFKMNFLNKTFQEKIYLPYFKHLLKIFSSSANLVKTNNISENTDIYAKKWDFEKNFLLKEYRKIDFVENHIEIPEEIFEDFTVIGVEKPKIVNTSLEKTTVNKITPKTFFGNLNDNDGYDNLDDYSRDSNITFDENVNNDKNIYQSLFSEQGDENKKRKSKKSDNKLSYNELIEKNKITFDIIITTLCSFNNVEKINKMDLIINDSYTKELKFLFKKLLNLDTEEIDEDFHILDIIIFKIYSLELINIEFNSLDNKTFDKILNLLFLNEKLKTVNLSFFSSDITYYPHMMLKLLHTLTNKKTVSGSSREYEYSVLDKVYPYYITNLLITFYIIRKNLNIENLGINFDIPDIIIKEGNYMNSIKKFILNILLLLNEENNNIKNLTILSPSTLMDGRTYNTIDNIFKNIKINEKKSLLIKLNIQFQFYKLPHITNIISSNLIYLSIGDLDLYTFSCLIQYLSSFKFSKISLLKQLSISLMKRIDELSPKLKVLLIRLFGIKLKNFKVLNLYTNVLLNEKSEYKYIIKILRNNWISDYTITFNEKSKGLVNKFYFYKDNIKFLVPHNLESELINVDENKGEKKLWTFQDDIIFWYLKYLFDNRYFYVTKRFNNNKKFIYNILKYIYFEKISKINHDFKEIKSNN